ncbi:uncharacterized protein PRCAT00001782001 [Priceomyces carsonii]|uniref:uncharacterized protein n=1 Tax=Priceomyces carsonii TaxID=28549 RepID=UPI002EDAF266|nr:unnamed protein product [Priceomyces carsonii]
MVSFFSSRKRNDSYQGFSKYNDDVHSQQLLNGLPSNGSSLSNGAGQAAVAALRMHSQPATQQRREPFRNSNYRNTAGNNVGRSNSMRLYTYNPTASYTAGRPIYPGSRLNSLKAPNYSNRASSLNSQSARYSNFAGKRDENTENEEGDIVVTTTTTKILDSMGRTLSITTKTVKTLPDGSNVIETTTKNISRNNSRSNSLRNSSRSNSLRHNSMLSNNNSAAINLGKIDEDLQDFDYNYELDSERIESAALNLNLNGKLGSPISEHAIFTNKNNRESLGDSARTSLKPVLSQESSQKPLKSILKHRTDEDESEFKDAVDSLEETKSSHPYKPLSTQIVSNPQKFKVPATPAHVKQSQTKDDRQDQISPNSNNLQIHNNLNSNSSVISPSSGSIKFVEEPETIPLYSKSHKTHEEADMYAKAMEAAMKKVYGDKQANTIPIPVKNKQKTGFGINRLSSISNMSSHSKNKKEPEYSGVHDNYTYENHHKSFIGLSLRDEQVLQRSKKDKAKEESRAKKEAELAEKKAKKESDLIEKQSRKESQLAERKARKIANQSEKSARQSLLEADFHDKMIFKGKKKELESGSVLRKNSVSSEGPRSYKGRQVLGHKRLTSEDLELAALQAAGKAAALDLDNSKGLKIDDESAIPASQAASGVAKKDVDDAERRLTKTKKKPKKEGNLIGYLFGRKGKTKQSENSDEHLNDGAPYEELNKENSQKNVEVPAVTDGSISHIQHRELLTSNIDSLTTARTDVPIIVDVPIDTTDEAKENNPSNCSTSLSQNHPPSIALQVTPEASLTSDGSSESPDHNNVPSVRKVPPEAPIKSDSSPKSFDHSNPPNVSLQATSKAELDPMSEDHVIGAFVMDDTNKESTADVDFEEPSVEDEVPKLEEESEFMVVNSQHDSLPFKAIGSNDVIDSNSDLPNSLLAASPEQKHDASLDSVPNVVQASPTLPETSEHRATVNDLKSDDSEYKKGSLQDQKEALQDVPVLKKEETSLSGLYSNNKRADASEEIEPEMFIVEAERPYITAEVRRSVSSERVLPAGSSNVDKSKLLADQKESSELAIDVNHSSSNKKDDMKSEKPKKKKESKFKQRIYKYFINTYEK